MDNSRARTVAALFFGFVLTGIGTALLGCVLPALTRQWHIPDNRAGALFAAQFLGSALGALLVAKSIRQSLLGGYILLFLGALTVALLPGLPGVLRFFVFGLGLGLTMTSTSLWIGQIYARNRGQALSLLNAFWTLGAALSPTVATLWNRSWLPTHLFLVIGAASLCSFAVLAPISENRVQPATIAETSSARHLAWIVLFASLGFLYVGVEASIGSWIMSYVHRLPDVNQVWAPIVTSCFWMAILVGRLLAPAALARHSERTVLSACIAIALFSAAAMLATGHPLAITITIALAGVALGPIYPLCLSQAMHALTASRHTKWVFAFPGIGAVLFPYLTGIVSSRENSLRAGLLVPVFILIAMLCLDRLQPALQPHPAS